MKQLIFAIAIAVNYAIFAQAPKYVFVFIGDGMSVPQRMVAEEFSRATRNAPLAMNDMPFTATTRTRSHDSLVTDSAAAATAIACGAKTRNHSTGVGPDGERLYSCAEAARDAGRKVGIMSTVMITHATPAGFYGHRKSRGETYGLALDLINSKFDFFAGGGLDKKFDDKKHPNYNGNAYELAERNGYKVIKTKDDFLALKPGCGKILTRFTDSTLSPAIDDDGKYPTLAEIVAKAVEVLDGEQGFFIMAEGGRIDWSGHANDAATNLRDVLALDDAVKVATGFLERHPNETLVIVTGDHETGGMAMGFAGTGYHLYVELLANQKVSTGVFASKVAALFKQNPQLDFSAIQPLITECYGFKFDAAQKDDPMKINDAERKQIQKAFDEDIALYRARISETKAYDAKRRYQLGSVCQLVLSHKCGIGWSSGAHTAMPVLTTAKGCCAEKFSGFIENADIGKRIKALYGK